MAVVAQGASATGLPLATVAMEAEEDHHHSGNDNSQDDEGREVHRGEG